MQLKSFHVQRFRNIIDSGPVKVDGNTCLVGKNEAGKSAVVQALHRLNPAKPVALDLLDEYPRWLKKEHEISGTIDDAVPIEATYELSTTDVEQIEERFGKGILKSREIAASRKYKGEMQIKLPLDVAKFLKGFIGAHLSGQKAKLGNPTTAAELLTSLATLSAETAGDAKEATQDAQAAKLAKAELAKVLGNEKTSVDQAVEAIVRPMVPRTFYFSNYAQLQGRYPLPDVLAAVKSGSKSEPVQTAADFLRLARVTSANVDTWNYEQAKAELEAVSSLLTQRVKSNWKQNQHLKLVVEVEATPNAQGSIERFLQFRVEDSRHDFSNPLDRRSTGFQWFVSFIASFFEFEKDKNLILLLDEPGLSLHARAQMDLLDAIDKHLTGGRQVIYTTHSPFMVRTEALGRVRIVEDKGPEKGATVTNDAGVVSDPDTLFPLQAALGYDIAQNLFIGARNIIVEGISDFIYLTVLSTHLRGQGRASIPLDSRLLPAGGATNIPTFIALLGGKLDIVVLLDGKASTQKIKQAISEGRLAANRVFNIASFSTVPDADIEDLFEPAEYLAIYNSAFGKSLKEKDLTGSDRITKRIARKEGGDFDHGQVAAHFLAQQGKLLSSLSAGSLKRFEELIDAMVKALPSP